MHTQACLQVTSASSCDTPLACSGRAVEVEVVEVVEEVVVEVVGEEVVEVIAQVEMEVEHWLMLTFPREVVDEEVTGKTAGMYYIFSLPKSLLETFIYFFSPNPYWKLIYIFSLPKSSLETLQEMREGEQNCRRPSAEEISLGRDRRVDWESPRLTVSSSLKISVGGSYLIRAGEEGYVGKGS